MDTKSKPFFVRLPNRGAVRVSGPDRVAFLQPLISNDLRLLETQAAVYSCFLSPQGKFLHDFFVSREGEALILECEGAARAEDLARRLKPFKLRSKIEMSVEPAVEVFAIVAPLPPTLTRGSTPLPLGEGLGGEGGAYSDPRHPDLGWRMRVKPVVIDEQPFAVWDEMRLRLGVPDGSRDMALDKDTLLECRMDEWRGVSFEKGCYIGQEITARMKLRGLVKKHLVPVTIKGAAPAAFSDIFINEQLVGQMRSRCGAIGLALLKDETLEVLQDVASPLALA